jgi:hypothetical protein
MLPYRVTSEDGPDGTAVFYDATASQAQAISQAKTLKAQRPSMHLTVDVEEWPALTRVQYLRYVLIGTRAGFGMIFAQTYRFECSAKRQVWPQQKC